MTDSAAAQTDSKTLQSKAAGQKRLSVRLWWWLMAGVAVLLAIHLVFQYYNLLVFDEKHATVFELSNRFDFDDESSLPTWLSQALFLSFGAVCFFAAYLERAKAGKRLWKIIGAVGVLVSLDEVMAFHETFLQQLHTYFFGDAATGFVANAWLFVIPFVLAAGGALLWQMLKAFPGRTVWLFALGGGLFVAGAVGIDIITNAIPRDTFLNQGILVALEEGAEMVSGAVFLYAAIDYLETHHLTRIRAAFAELGRRKA